MPLTIDRTPPAAAECGFLAQLAEIPNDDTARLAYVDWLTEHERYSDALMQRMVIEPGRDDYRREWADAYEAEDRRNKPRAEFVRIQVALESRMAPNNWYENYIRCKWQQLGRLERGDPRVLDYLRGHADNLKALRAYRAEQEDLEQRQSNYMRNTACAPTWAAGRMTLDRAGNTSRLAHGWPTTVVRDEGAGIPTQSTFTRGFIGRVRCSEAYWLSDGWLVAANNPVELGVEVRRHQREPYEYLSGRWLWTTGHHPGSGFGTANLPAKLYRFLSADPRLPGSPRYYEHLLAAERDLEQAYVLHARAEWAGRLLRQ